MKDFNAPETVEIQFAGIDLTFFHGDPHSKYFFDKKWWVQGRYVHEQPVGCLYIQHVKDASLVLDIGANIGWYSLLASKKTTAPVHAFEMDDTNFALLAENLRLNDAWNVRAWKTAVSDTVGVANYSDSLHGSDSRSGLHLAVNEEECSQSSLRSIETLTLDSQFASLNGAVVKIDVEGAEQQVLNGARRLLEQSQRVALFIEVHPEIKNFGYSSQDLIEFLLELGFRVNQITNMRSTCGNAVIEPVLPEDVLPLPQALIYATKGHWQAVS